MKVLILAGGLGTRISEETLVKPKPMVEIGGYPILWHIMKIYSYYGFNDFIILLGYKGYLIKEYFANFFIHNSNLEIDLTKNYIQPLNTPKEKWKITLLDTGINTMTGGRILQAKPYLDDETFMFTYGDGVSNINIKHLLKFHTEHKKLITMSAILPEGRYGAINFGENNIVEKFSEKPMGDKLDSNFGWVNAGFFVAQTGIFDYIENNQTIFEQTSLVNLAKNKELIAYRHNGFWKCMDTLRDKNDLETMWHSNPIWKIWDK